MQYTKAMLRFPVLSILLCLPVAGCGETIEDSGTDGTAGTGTGGGGTGTGTGLEVDYDADIQPIFNENCLCHMEGSESMDMTAPYLTLNPGRAYDNLVGAPAEQLPSMNRIEPGEPDESYLWHKLNGTAGSVEGAEDTQMPLGGMLQPVQLELIEAWILDGAAP